MKKVLNVGGNSKKIPLPPEYEGWEHVLLDIDPKSEADVLCDARNLSSFDEDLYDSIYCSHNLEHYHRHDAVTVLKGFAHVLKPDGFVYLRVPDIGEVMRMVVEKNLDIDDFLYQSPAGPIMVRDVIYGYSVEIERSGNDFFAHKTGFTQKALVSVLNMTGFGWVFSGTGNLEVKAFAFLTEPNDVNKRLLSLPS